MKFSQTKPPIFDRLHKQFGVEWGGNLCVAYGDTIHHSKELTSDVLMHESFHLSRQKDPTQWWERYIRDSKFRFIEELLAYRVQYKFLKSGIKDRNEIARHLFRLAKDLSSMYNLPINHTEALKLIKME